MSTSRSLVLIVDDESGMRDLLKRQLAGLGHASLEARTAEEALYLLGLTKHIHVVVADLQMPGHGGAWLVEQIRQRFPTVAVVLATADDTVPGTLSLQSSVLGYLVKPIDGNQLAEAVTLGIRWHKQQAKASQDRAAGADPIESWLDKKLTRGPDDSES